MELTYECMPIIKAMVEIGNPNSVTDAGVGALCARTAVIGAGLNVKINASGYDDKAFTESVLQKAAEIEKNTIALENEILAMVHKKMQP